jgi:Cdc6-like AAA superfamily ATPase
MFVHFFVRKGFEFQYNIGFLILMRILICLVLTVHIESLHFKPYTTEQIIAIIKQRLSSVEERIFEENAITLLAKKIASSSGDIRKALDVCE